MSDIEIFSYDPFTVEIDREGGMYPKYTVTIYHVLRGKKVMMDYDTFETRDAACEWAEDSLEEFAYSLSTLLRKMEGVS